MIRSNLTLSKTLVLSCTASCLLLLALAACSPPASDGKGKTDLPKEKVALLLSEVDVTTIQAGFLATGPVITGSVQPERRAELRSEVAATVTQVLKDNGEPVAAGELLVRLDDTSLRESLASADESVRASSAGLEQAERAAARLRALQAQGMTTAQALDDAEQRRVAANSELVAARARAATARQQLRRTEVRAPFAGILSERKVSVGDTAQIGKELGRVIDPRTMRFEGLVSADRMRELKIGQTVNFRVNGYAAEFFTGTVKRIDATANAGTRQMDVQVAFQEPAKAPRVAGLFAEGTVQTGGAQVLMVADSAVVRAGDAAHVWKLQGNTVRKSAVKLGPRDARSGQWPVLEGLAAGDRVLRSPSSNVSDGQGFELTAALAPTTAAAPAASAAR